MVGVMSNRLTDEMKEEMRGEIIDTLRAVQKEHLQNQKAKKNDTEEMQIKISELEILYREIDSNFQHFTPAIYQALGLRPPKAKIEIKPLGQSSEEDFSDDTQSQDSPRKKQPLPQLQEDDEDYGHTVNVEDLPPEEPQERKIEKDKPPRNPLVKLGIARSAKTNQPAPAPATAAPKVNSPVERNRNEATSNRTPTIPAAVVNNPVKNMELLFTSIAKVDLKYKTPAIADAIVLAKEEYHKDPSKAFKIIIDQIGQERKKMGAAARAESGFFKELMKIIPGTDVLKDPDCRAVLENKVNSLAPAQKKAVEKLLDATKDIAPTVSKK